LGDTFRCRCPSCGKVVVFPKRRRKTWEAVPEEGKEYPKHLLFRENRGKKMLCPHQFGREKGG